MIRANLLRGVIANQDSGGLISHWKLDEDPAEHNTVIVDSFGSNNGTLITNDGSTNKSVAGPVDKAISFDGTDDHAGFGDIGHLESYSISLWINGNIPESTNLYLHCVSKGGVFNNNSNYFFGIRTRADLTYHLFGGHRDGSTLIFREVDFLDLSAINGNWNHIVFTYSTDFNFYLNAAELTTRKTGSNDTAPITAPSGTTDETRIGGPINTASNNRFFSGSIDDVRLYNRALSESEIQEIYNGSAPPEELLIVELGQSNMEGQDGDDPLHTIPAGDGYFWDDAGSQAVHLTNDRGDANGGSHATYFAERLREFGYVPTMIEAAKSSSGLTTASGGSLFRSWASEGSLRGDAEAQITNAVAALDGFTAPSYALWCQGESDAWEMNSDEAYTPAIVKAAMQDVIDWWQVTYPGVPFLISQTGLQSSGNEGFISMQQIQQEIVDENAGVYMANTNAVNYPSLGWMVDSVHHAWEGLRDKGRAFAEQINSLLNP